MSKKEKVIPTNLSISILEEELKEEILKQASQAGTSTNRDIRIVNDIGSAKQLIDWRYILRECKNILQYTKLKVGCFDTEFYGFHEIRTEKNRKYEV